MKIVKQRSWRYYDRWRKERTYCPALKSEVRISLKGWKHITGATPYKKRKLSDVYRRLKLLKHAKRIIKSSTTIQNISIRNKSKYYVLEAIVNVRQDGKTKPRKIRVVIQQDRAGSFIFLSVMDKKGKN